MSALLVGALLVAAVCACARRVRPITRAAGARAPLDVEMWHVVMGIAMVAMVLTSMSERQSRAAMVIFGGGAVWSAARVVGRVSRAAYVRLGVSSTAMVAMFVPASSSGPAAAGSMGGMKGMAGMRGAVGTPASSLPPGVAIGLVVAMIGVFVAAATRLAAHSIAPRSPALTPSLHATGEMLMAAAMTYMLAGLA